MLPIEKMSKALVGSRVLLIDDSESFQRLTAAMLDKLGVGSVTLASSLAEGMHEMNYHCPDEFGVPAFDLVLMDINLPDGNGIEGCQFISSHAGTYNIPVVVMSGTSYALTINEAFEAGASDYLQKPLAASILENRLGMLMTINFQARGFENSPNQMAELRLAIA
ncbi:MAG: response regulator [Gammaproteobacteria bacterium]|nr:response regulator [Gammaproteobacteria bacterium]